jgi:hypothetical protein
MSPAQCGGVFICREHEPKKIICHAVFCGAHGYPLSACASTGSGRNILERVRLGTNQRHK